MSTQTFLERSFPTPCKRCGGALHRQVDYCPYCGTVQPLDAGPHKRTVIPGSRASASAASRIAQKLGFDTSGCGSETGLAERDTRVNENASAEATLRAPTLATLTPSTPPAANLPAGISVGAPAGLSAGASAGISTSAPARMSAGAPAGMAARAPEDLSDTHARVALLIRKVLLGIAAIVAIGLVLVGYAIFRADSDSDTDSGAIDQTSNTTVQDGKTTTGTIARYASPAPTLHPNSQGHQTAALKPVVPKAPMARTIPVTPLAPVAPPIAVAPAKPAAPRFRDATQALQAARVAFRGNDLSTAQIALTATQTLAPGNSEAQDLMTQLKPLIARRDAALQAAQSCIALQSWGCARQYANDAFAIDSGSDTAKSMLEGVIRESGWAPLNPQTTTSNNR